MSEAGGAPVQDALERAMAAALVAAGAESRHVFARVRPEPGGTFRFETNSEPLLEPALAQLRPVAGDVPVHAVLLPEPALAGQAAWVRASVAEVRRAPAHAAEQISQALQGEVLLPLIHEGGWLLARQPDGYVGWVRDWHLTLGPAAGPQHFASRATARVNVNWGALRAEPRHDADACGETILGTLAVVQSRAAGWVEVELAGGVRGWVPEGSLLRGTGLWPCGAAHLAATLRRFLGVPYLWGGKSPKGFDCSGLVQFAYGMHGVALPRDSDQQARCGVPAEEPEPGDLLFFGHERVTHVAVALGDGDYVHARGEVRRNSLLPDSPLYDAELRGLWCDTRRVLPPAS
jgi:gamma-D-glutamyl-L-lysine dipeptidyl-peptidase